jgi:UDP-2-acetamido-3-amino-2,3-dideoxy-glucuronate N-acetyltransferase
MADAARRRSPLFHDTALVESDSIGEGTRIWAFAHVMRDAVVGRDCKIGDHVFIESGAVLGDSVTVKNGVSIWDHVRIGDKVFLGPNVALTNDRYPRRTDEGYDAEPIRIEEGATIGANATIVCGVRIGRWALIGAGTVVTTDVPPHALVFGNPGRQHGWVCHCARPLELGGQEVVSCQRCGRRYDVTDAGVRQRA